MTGELERSGSVLGVEGRVHGVEWKSWGVEGALRAGVRVWGIGEGNSCDCLGVHNRASKNIRSVCIA